MSSIVSQRDSLSNNNTRDQEIAGPLNDISDEDDLFDLEHADSAFQYSEEVDDSRPSEWMMSLFVLISFGYMLPWTSLGSLITYYKEAYSASFYVKLYCAYYLPGLPISLLQYKYDVYLDYKYGSRQTYLLRGLFSYIIMISILISLIWLRSRLALLFLFSILGVCAWLCHGTASMLASMFPPSAIAYLQTGFRCPEIYTIIAVTILHIGKHATIPKLNIFYVCTAVVCMLGVLSWVTVVTGETSTNYFDIKDHHVKIEAGGELEPLLNKQESVLVGGVVVKTIGRSISVKKSAQSGSHVENISIGSLTDDQILASTYILNADEIQANAQSLNQPNSYSNFSSYAKPLTKSKQSNENNSIVHNSNSLQISFVMSDETYHRIFPLCIALIIVIFCSIFQASFFPYVRSPKGREIEVSWLR